jgi:tetratricopeptide (TPR) repeat protein
MPISDAQLGAALRTLLTRHGLALLAPDDHAGTGYAWSSTDDPSDIVDGYATLNDLLVDALRAIGLPPGERRAAAPDPVDLGFARLSQGIEMIAAALHCATDVPIPQALIIVAGMQMQQPEDLHDPVIHTEAVDALHALVERGLLLLAANDGILIPSRLRDTLIHALETAGMPLLIGQERIERALATLVPHLIDDEPDSDGLLREIAPHLHHVTAAAQHRRAITGTSLGIVQTRLHLRLNEPHQAAQTIAQLLALLDLGVLKGHPRRLALLLADDLADLGNVCARHDDPHLRQRSARHCYDQVLALRRKGLSPHDPVLAETYTRVGLLAQEDHDLAAAQQAHRQALAIWEARAVPDEQAQSHLSLARVAYEAGDTVTARQHYAQVLAFPARHTAMHVRHMEAATGLGILEYLAGDLNAARDSLEQAVARMDTLDESLDAEVSTIQTLTTLGLVLRDQGDLTAARRSLEQAIAVSSATLGAQHLVTRAVQAELADLR